MKSKIPIDFLQDSMCLVVSTWAPNPMDSLQGGPQADRYQHGVKTPINGRKSTGNWDYNPTYTGPIPPFITGFWAHLVQTSLDGFFWGPYV